MKYSFASKLTNKPCLQGLYNPSPSLRPSPNLLLHLSRDPSSSYYGQIVNVNSELAGIRREVREENIYKHICHVHRRFPSRKRAIFLFLSLPEEIFYIYYKCNEKKKKKNKFSRLFVQSCFISSATFNSGLDVNYDT